MTTFDRPYLRDLAAAQRVAGPFSIHNTQLGLTRTNKHYIRCLLGDCTGKNPARMWNASDEIFKQLPTDGFVWVEGETQPYQGQMQIIIHSIKPHEPTDSELRQLLPACEKDIDQMFRQLVARLNTIENPAIKCLAERYLEDGQLMDQLCQAPAAMTLHHAYLGGLLEHTLTVLDLAEQVLPLYPQLNRDIVIMGLFVHDLGKCAELNWRQGFTYSTDGQLVGHIARGIIWLEEKAKACQQLDPPVTIPERILQVLHHIILSHHGQPEFGALKVPATPEALAVAMIDNLDAKLNMALGATRSEAAEQLPDSEPFTDRIWALSNARFYRPDPTTVDAEL